ncbi:MAG: hypothetical protein CM1200mP20_04430 [Pseudomonadota bacterium]|nr:MAG: hypothetical protein CM1200mP20_04430 [Pseudomonadota bacterium]
MSRRLRSHLDVPIEVPHLGTVSVDVAWGGMFYVIAETSPAGPGTHAVSSGRGGSCW